jgi:PTS system glucitol/sorbitol-specific IIA component
LRGAYYRSRILRLGEEVRDLVSGDVLILFAEPVPPQLESVSAIHAPATELGRSISVSDRVRLGATELEITAVGSVAADNLRRLGHVVLYGERGATDLLPGALHVRGRLVAPQPGDVLELLPHVPD